MRSPLRSRPVIRVASASRSWPASSSARRAWPRGRRPSLPGGAAVGQQLGFSADYWVYYSCYACYLFDGWDVALNSGHSTRISN